MSVIQFNTRHWPKAIRRHADDVFYKMINIDANKILQGFREHIS